MSHGSYAGSFGSKADNTVRENKNNGCLKQLSMMVSKKLARCCGYFFSRVGHTRAALGLLFECAIAWQNYTEHAQTC